MRAKLVFVFLALSSLPAVAAPIIGHGTDTCAEFLQARVISPVVEDSYWVWTQGFMSGVNTMLITAKSPSRNLTAKPEDDQRKAVRDYCSTHSTDTFASAVAKILFAFPESPPIAK